MAIAYVRVRRIQYELYYFPNPRPYLPSSLVLTHPSHPNPNLTSASKVQENPTKKTPDSPQPIRKPRKTKQRRKRKKSLKEKILRRFSLLSTYRAGSRDTRLWKKKKKKGLECNRHLCFWLRIYVCSARCSESLRKCFNLNFVKRAFYGASL